MHATQTHAVYLCSMFTCTFPHTSQMLIQMSTHDTLLSVTTWTTRPPQWQNPSALWADIGTLVCYKYSTLKGALSSNFPFSPPLLSLSLSLSRSLVFIKVFTLKCCFLNGEHLWYCVCACMCMCACVCVRESWLAPTEIIFFSRISVQLYISLPYALPVSLSLSLSLLDTWWHWLPPLPPPLLPVCFSCSLNGAQWMKCNVNGVNHCLKASLGSLFWPF